jgi:hypothetical protein
LADESVDASSLLVLIDGIDEAFPSAYRQMGSFDPTRVSLSYPHIATCRDDFFRRSLGGAEFCTHYDEILFIEPWTIDREVPLFLENYLGELDSDVDAEKKKELLGLIERFAQGEDARLTPLVVTTILFLWRYDYDHMMRDEPKTFAALLGRFLQIWARREAQNPACASGSEEELLAAYEDTAWMLYETRASQGELLQVNVIREFARKNGVGAKQAQADRGVLSVLRISTGGQVLSFAHEALYEYLLARMATRVLATKGARGPIVGRLLGHSVNELGRQILGDLPGDERGRVVAQLEREYFRLRGSTRGLVGRIVRWVGARVRGGAWAKRAVDDATVRRVNVCYFWGRLEANTGGERIKCLFDRLVARTLWEHEMVVNTVGSSILLLDDAELERAYIERLSDDGAVDRCNRSYHRVYYGDAGYTSPDGLLRDELAGERDDWPKTRQALLRRLSSQEDRDVRLRSLDLVTFRRLCETRGIPRLGEEELRIISDSTIDLGVLIEDRRDVVRSEHSLLCDLLASDNCGDVGR